LTLPVGAGDTDVRVRLQGGLDLCTAPYVAAGLAPLTEPRGDRGAAVRGTVCLDLADLTFLDPAGLTALVRARSALRASGWHVRLTAPQPAVRRLLEHAVRSGWSQAGALLPTELLPTELLPTEGESTGGWERPGRP